jgi:hypothetical protein
MNHRGLWLLVGIVALAGGCSSDSPSGTAPADRAAAEAQRNILALEPRNMAHDANRRPSFQWRLPPMVSKPDLVTFTLYEVGKMEAPERDKPTGTRMALATGLDATSPTGLNLWEPPTGCVLTGDIRDTIQLKPETWYRWNVRAIAGEIGTDADFYFRTRAEEAVSEVTGLPPLQNQALPPLLPKEGAKPQMAGETKLSPAPEMPEDVPPPATPKVGPDLGITPPAPPKPKLPTKTKTPTKTPAAATR